MTDLDHAVVLRHVRAIRVQRPIGVKGDEPQLLRRRMHLRCSTNEPTMLFARLLVDER